MTNPTSLPAEVKAAKERVLKAHEAHVKAAVAGSGWLATAAEFCTALGEAYMAIERAAVAAHLARAAEREACAEIADEHKQDADQHGLPAGSIYAGRIANLIRARDQAAGEKSA